MTDSFSQTEEDKRSMATAPSSPAEIWEKIAAIAREEGGKPEGIANRVMDLLGELEPSVARETGAAGQLSALLDLPKRWRELAGPSEAWEGDAIAPGRATMHQCADELEKALAVPQSEPQACGCILFGSHTVKLCESHWLALTPPFPHEAAAAPKPAKRRRN